MISALLALWLQTAIGSAVTAPPTLVVRNGAATVTIPVLPASTNAIIPADRLAAAIGGKLSVDVNGRYTLTVGESRLSFIPGIPFAHADSETVPLVGLPTVSGNTLYLPFHVVSEVIPRMMTGLIYDAELGEMRSFNATARRADPVPPPPSRVTPRPPTPSPVTADATAVRPRRRTKHLVVVDAGHGGKDGGMTGPIAGGPKIREKHITLAVAKLLAQELREKGVDVYMTRTTDTLIDLADRGRLANKNRGDVFVSIHVNALDPSNRHARTERGYETYFLAEAKTEDARRVEAMENQSVRFETNVNARNGDPLSLILNDMAQNEHLRESNELAQIIQDDFRTFHPGPNRGVQQANFAVLRGSYMPAVLVEIGFGTNAAEAAYISDATNQRAIARSLAKSVMAYLDRYDARVGGGR